MPADFRDILLAYLHDPPDKALQIQGHVRRALRNAGVLSGEFPLLGDEEAHADQFASAIERLPMPSAGPEGERAVRPTADGKLRINHPLSGDRYDLDVPALDEAAVQRALPSLGADNDPFDVFLAVWRCWPDNLAALHRSFARLPADTRIPDHTIWNHVEMVAGLRPAVADAKGPALFVFNVSTGLGLQGFIAAARSVRDLWSGSMLLSHLAFKAVLPVVEELGPCAVVYPALRGLPWMDDWMRQRPALAPLLPERRETNQENIRRKAPCLPNKFVAVVPYGVEGKTATALAERCRTAAQQAWTKIASSVWRELNAQWSSDYHGWDRLWAKQIEGFFQFHTSVLPLRDAADRRDEVLAELLSEAKPTEKASRFEVAFPGVHKVRKLADQIPSLDRYRYHQNSAGSWQQHMDLAMRLLEAERAVRPIPAPTPSDQDVPPKCSVLGSYEQMGPAALEDSKEFWQQTTERFKDKGSRIGGVRVGARERLCAVSLVKRFCGPAYFVQALRLDGPDDLRFDDTATIAASLWLKKAREEHPFPLLDPDRIRRRQDIRMWSGQWLHWSSTKQDKDEVACPDDVFAQIQEARRVKELGKPPAYYAVLMIDGDDMGKWLRGDKSPKVRDVIHPDLVRYYESLPEKEAIAGGLNHRRPIGPALHAAISTALANFALNVVPEVVAHYGGTLIYAGGDDVLALLPVETALDCADHLRRAYSGESDPVINGGADPGYHRAQRGDLLLMMGPTATLSAGIAVVHYKEDLRFALEQSRAAEKDAKHAGKNALAMRVCRRSGEHSRAVCPWPFVDRVRGLTGAFLARASDRWAYRLKADLETLERLPQAAVEAELRRQVSRAEKATQDTLVRHAAAGEEGKKAPEILADDLADFRKVMKGRDLFAGREVEEWRRDAEVLKQFLTLVQTASFLARGRDL